MSGFYSRIVSRFHFVGMGGGFCQLPTKTQGIYGGGNPLGLLS
jgi:hypothetical protein